MAFWWISTRANLLEYIAILILDSNVLDCSPLKWVIKSSFEYTQAEWIVYNGQIK